MDFDTDIRAEVLGTLPCDLTARAELEALNAADLLVIYLSWQKRFIPPRPRTVHRSGALRSNPLVSDPAYGPDLETLIRKFEAGDDVNPHLSERVTQGYTSQTSASGPFSRRRDLDLLLNDWDVHHLHLSNTLQSTGFVERTAPLLFAVFKPDDVYLIDLFGHRVDWTRDRIFEIMIDNWPDAGLVRLLPQVVDLASQPTESDRAKLRGAGIASNFVERNGKVYYVGSGGLSSAGTSIQCTRQANVIRVVLNNFKKIVEV